MPDADPRLDRGRWAAASLRPLPEAPPPSSSSSSASPAPSGHAPRGLWRRLAGCCGCCRRAGREDWDPQPGEVPGTRPPQRIRPGLLVPTGLVLGSAANRVAHHTAAFAGPLLVVRRGQPFELRLLLPRPFDPEGDALCVELLLGPTPQVAKGTHVLIPLGERSATGWTAEVAGEEAEPEGAGPGGHALILNLSAPPDAPIGRYRVSVKTRTGEGEFAAPFSPGNDVVLLFNPWCPEDAVFMEPTSDLDEFVLNESGTIFYGTEEQIAERAWNYGQFEPGVLEACLFMLDRRGMPHSARGDPVMVTRVVSAMVNSLDDNGVLVGNWTGDYSRGTNPSAWAGSVAILRRFHGSGAPVRYGQCWVFAGVVTTVLRCLGVPTRTVTNYNSAHDTDVSLTTDIYFDENMRPLERLNTDSVWNFHVWNDCWMKRPDLPEGYDGWQVVDATPQETSSGLFCCGPCSVAAVKNGDVFLKYDTPFVFAEVNSDKVYWQRQPGGGFAVVHVEGGAIGRRISTLGAGSRARLDITDQYKHPEGSEAERRAVATATAHGSRPRPQGAPNAPEGGVAMSLGAGPAVMGAELELRVNLRNEGAEPRTLKLRLSLAAVRYTGVTGTPFRSEQHHRALSPGEGCTVRMAVPYGEYRPALGQQDALKLTGPLGHSWVPPELLGPLGHSWVPPQLLGPLGYSWVPPELLGPLGHSWVPPELLGPLGHSWVPPQLLGPLGHSWVRPQLLCPLGHSWVPPQLLGPSPNSWVPPLLLCPLGHSWVPPQLLGPSPNSWVPPELLGPLGHSWVPPELLGPSSTLMPLGALLGPSSTPGSLPNSWVPWGSPGSLPNS